MHWKREKTHFIKKEVKLWTTQNVNVHVSVAVVVKIVAINGGDLG